MFRPGISALAALALFAAPTWGVRHDDWVEVRSRNFVVVSNAGEHAARATATHFEQIRAVFDAALPVATAHQSPVITILAVKDAASLRELLSPFWEEGRAAPAGIFSHRLDQFYIALELDLNGENPYANLYHEYFHSLTTPYYPNLPAWLAEGLAEFYGNTRIDRGGVTMGLPDAARVEQLAHGPLIPLPVLFEVDHASPYYNEQLKTSMFYAESWALAHYLMVGDHGAHKQSLTDYLASMNAGTTAELAALQTFGDLTALETELANYVRNGSFANLQAPARSEKNDPQLTARPISDEESIALRGGFLAVQGQTQEAVSVLGKLVERNPRSALAQRNLAMALFFAGRRAEAFAAASRAIALEPHDALTHYIRAYLSFDGSMLPQKPQMEADLRAAITLNANFGSPYSMLAAYLAAQNKDLDDALAAAQKSVSFEPGNGAYQLVLAKVLGRMKRCDEARDAASAALADAKNPNDRTEADHFLMFLNRSEDFPTDARLTHPLQP